MSSSAEAAAAAPLETPELGRGTWTRLGDLSVLGDSVTEHALAGLAEATRQSARSQGYAVGWAEGKRVARREAEEAAAAAAAAHEQAEHRREREHRAAVAALEEAAAQLRQAVLGACTRVEDAASGLAWELTEELVGHALEQEDGLATIRRVLALAPHEPLVAVRLNPAVAARAGELHDHGVAVVPDATMLPGDAVAETALGALDVRISTALDRVRAVLA